MATLEADVTSRVSTQRLVELTNPNDVTATTVDATRLSLAVDDVQGDFRIYAGVTYDSTDSRHVSVGVDGVLLKLAVYINNNREDYTAWVDERLKPLRNVTNNDRMLPQTKSKLTPADENPGGQVKRPPLDVNEAFIDTLPNMPS